ncbi:hypothetical protein [Phytohabitans rumicis]|uniref:Uncharacterized protein n=1 Tax=Phytohabitans rumicis TaxID=1076125 RepID=A0A6V8LN15_9ACTN|nr:hypothetical protein [Phytohabitans rumicis]GFJ95566.1 hypothetical protein Prum_092080 [Phytohabitans rumicis]
MPVIHAPWALRGAARAAAAAAFAIALLAGIPPTATAARPTAAASTTATAASPTEVQATKARLLAAIEPCATRVPRNDVVALGQCTRDLAVPNAEPSQGIIDLIYTFLYCLWLQWDDGTWDGPYPTVGACMEVHGY